MVKTIPLKVDLTKQNEILEMSKDDIIDNKAFIWACGRNVDGELAIGMGKESINTPKNIS